jgi:hypothetical protein
MRETEKPVDNCMVIAHSKNRRGLIPKSTAIIIVASI